MVGAGAAGLSAAAALTSAGLQVRCLEARDRVGGRLQSVPARAGGRLDLGASWSWEGEHRVAALLARLGLASHAQHLTGDALYDAPPGVQRLQGNPIDVPAVRYTGGAQSLPEALAATLAPGTVALGTPVRGVSADGSGVRVDLDDGPLHAAHVVLAVRLRSPSPPSPCPTSTTTCATWPPGPRSGWGRPPRSSWSTRRRSGGRPAWPGPG